MSWLAADVIVSPSLTVLVSLSSGIPNHSASIQVHAACLPPLSARSSPVMVTNPIHVKQITSHGLWKWVVNGFDILVCWFPFFFLILFFLSFVYLHILIHLLLFFNFYFWSIEFFKGNRVPWGIFFFFVYTLSLV